MIGVDLGKRSFQLRGVREDGSAVFRKKVSRERFLAEVSGHRPRIVAMEACGGARHWGRELQSMGFEVRLVPTIYVKPFVKRHKDDAADALRGPPAEHGVVVPQRIANIARLAAEIDDPESRLPETVRDLGHELLEQIGIFDTKIGNWTWRCASGRRRATKRSV